MILCEWLFTENIYMQCAMCDLLPRKTFIQWNVGAISLNKRIFNLDTNVDFNTLPNELITMFGCNVLCIADFTKFTNLVLCI